MLKGSPRRVSGATSREIVSSGGQKLIYLPSFLCHKAIYRRNLSGVLGVYRENHCLLW